MKQSVNKYCILRWKCLTVQSAIYFVALELTDFHIRLCINMDGLTFQVVLPFVEKYFRAHREYFVGGPNAPNTNSMASVKEKEMTARYCFYISKSFLQFVLLVWFGRYLTR